MAMPMSLIPYHVGQRYVHVQEDRPLAVRFVGSLETLEQDNPAKTVPIWLGVEWDDATRGKHSGSRESKEYFQVRQEGSGSFLRYRAGNPARGKAVEPELSSGTYLWEAIREKYLSNDHELTGTNVEPVRWGKFREIEVPNIDKVANRLKTGLREGKLRVLDLAGSWLRGTGDTLRPDAINLSSVQILDVSRNLLAEWASLLEVSAEMPAIRTLIINHSRLPPLAAAISLGDNPLSHLRELHMRDSALTWSDVVHLASSLPEIQILDVGSNTLIGTSLKAGDAGFLLAHGTMRELDLTCCGLGAVANGWTGLMEVLAGCTSLRTLYLSSNPFDRIPVRRANVDIPFRRACPTLSSLVLFPTEIKSWSSIDNLAHWLLGLTELKLYPGPIAPIRRETTNAIGADAAEADAWSTFDGDFTGNMTGKKSDRAWVIAKLPHLKVLNGTNVSKQERIDSERAYVRRVAGMSVSDKVKRGFGRYVELCAEHGMDADTQAARPAKTMDLKSRMLRFNLISPSVQTSGFNLISDSITFDPSKSLSISLLPSSPLKLITTKLLCLIPPSSVDPLTSTPRTVELEWNVGGTEEEALHSLRERGGLDVTGGEKLDDVMRGGGGGMGEGVGRWIAVRKRGRVSGVD